jgi:hypothetical protein
MKIYKVYNATLDSYLDASWRHFGESTITGVGFGNRQDALEAAANLLEYYDWEGTYAKHDIRVIDFDVRTSVEDDVRDELFSILEDDDRYGEFVESLL